MSDVKRFGYFWDGSFDVKDDGAFIRYEDFAELKAQRDALAAENAALKSAISEHSEGFTVCPCCGTEHDSSHDDVCRTINETPATDAYLNSVRAEGVKILAERMQQTIDDAKLNSDEIGALAGAIFTGAAIAVQLRAGEPS